MVDLGFLAFNFARRIAPSHMPCPVAESKAGMCAPGRCVPCGEYPLLRTPALQSVPLQGPDGKRFSLSTMS